MSILGESAPELLVTKPEDLAAFIKRSEKTMEASPQMLKLLKYQRGQISLAGKWAPRENAADDKIAKKAGMCLVLWMSACASEAWRNMFITFSGSPDIVTYTEESSLKSRVQQVMSTDLGGNTNLQATAKLMVSRGRMFGVKRDAMPKRVIIVSDMQFDACSGGRTNFDAYCKVFKDAGYDVPTIVFWNVSGRFDGKAAPARAHDEGVILLSGFSKELMSVLIDNEPIPTPYDIMVKTLTNERCDQMV